MYSFSCNSIILFLVFFLFPAASSAVPDGLTLTWPGGGTGKVTFDGTKHAEKGYQCDACHVSGMFQTKKNADVMTMEAMKKGKLCGSCHDGKKAFSVTDPKKCNDCHKVEKKEGNGEKKDDKNKESNTKKKKRN